MMPVTVSSLSQKLGFTVTPTLPAKIREVIQMGSMYNDMPSEDEKESAWCPSATNLLGFGFRFVVQRNDSAVGRSHHGCKQSWHSMCPIAEKEDLSFTNDDVRAIVIQDMEMWWRRAVELQRQSLYIPQGDVAQSTMGCAIFNIGRILHAVQDSFAKGHVVRADTTPGSNCGNILLFQGYGLQDHDKHGNGDNAAKNPAAYGCALMATREVLRQWYLCSIYLTLQHTGSVYLIAFEKVFSNPCDMYGARLVEVPLRSEETPYSGLYGPLEKIYAFQEGVQSKMLPPVGMDASRIPWKPLNVATTKAGGALAAYYKQPNPDGLSPTFLKYVLKYTNGKTDYSKTVYIEYSGHEKKYTAGTYLCGSIYRSISDAILFQIETGNKELFIASANILARAAEFYGDLLKKYTEYSIQKLKEGGRYVAEKSSEIYEDSKTAVDETWQGTKILVGDTVDAGVSKGKQLWTGAITTGMYVKDSLGLEESKEVSAGSQSMVRSKHRRPNHAKVHHAVN